MRGAVPPFPIRLNGVVFTQLHRDSLTFTLPCHFTQILIILTHLICTRVYPKVSGFSR
jgi:hypothetical protein